MHESGSAALACGSRSRDAADEDEDDDEDDKLREWVGTSGLGSGGRASSILAARPILESPLQLVWSVPVAVIRVGRMRR